MAACENEVGGKHQISLCSGTQDGAIVSDALEDRLMLTASFSEAANPSQDLYLENEVGGKHQISLCSGTQDGAIVSDALEDRLMLTASFSEAANPSQDLYFAHQALPAGASARIRPAGSSSPKTRLDTARSGSSPASSRSSSAARGLASQA